MLEDPDKIWDNMHEQEEEENRNQNQK